MNIELNNKTVKRKYKSYTPKQIMYSFRINKKIIDKVKKEASKLSISTSAFMRQAILEKIENNTNLKTFKKRLKKVEDRLS